MLDNQAKRDIVLTSLRMYSGKKIIRENYSMICCPYHADKTPSGQIFHGPDTKVVGYFKCLGCGARKIWNELAKDIGCQPFSGVPPEDRYANSLRKTKEAEEKSTATFTLTELPKNYNWRGFNTNYLKKIGCQLGIYDDFDGKFVYMPISVAGNEEGYIKAAIKKISGRPSYVNKPGSWVKNYGLFPFDYSIKTMRKMRSNTIVLTEGPRDSLRLLEYGIPCMSILGTQTWTDFKSKLLAINDVDRVLIMLDGDPAGIEGTKILSKSLKQVVSTKIIPLWSIKGSPYSKWNNLPIAKQKKHKGKLWDGNSCPEWILDKIVNKYY